MADTDLVPFDGGTVGSRSTPQMGTQLRKASAAARQALLEMAAIKWNIDSKRLIVIQGRISDPQTGRKASYGELSRNRQLVLPISDDTVVTPMAERKITGTTVQKINLRSFITGKHQYVSDMKLPGMLYGKILRAPAYQSELLDADVSLARSMSGVTVVRDENFIGITAPSPQIADKAIQTIKATWKKADQPSRSEIFSHLKNTADGGNSDRNSGTDRGNLDQGMAAADIRHTESYKVDYIAHVPLEPRAALAQWEAGKLTVWTGTQRPFGVQQDLAGIFNIPKEMVRVIVPDTGSAYGGKHSAEAATEAARLARVVNKPVKLVWTREEEFTWAYFRPAGLIEVSSGVKKDGKLTAWKFHNYNSGPAAINIHYLVPNQQIAFHPAQTPLKQGSYRGLASTANVFARESHISDMAYMLKMDQIEFRLRNLQDERMRAVLMAASNAFGWHMATKTLGYGFGIATGFDKGGYVATCAEVIVVNKKVKVIRITEAFECGAIVNPAHLESQIMGSIVQGLGGALFEAIDFADGKILNPSFSSYRVPRFRDVPRIEIVMVDRKDLPSAGAGEAPIIGVAPAIRNAILDATGIGLKTLPLIPDGVLI